MNGITIAIIANILLAVSLVIDKIFLKGQIKSNVTAYAFWIGILSIFGAVVMPFGFSFPTFYATGIALLSGFIFLGAMATFYTTLNLGEASRTLPIVGAFVPISTAIIGSFLLHDSLNEVDKLGFGLLVIGGIGLALSEKANLRKIFIYSIVTSLLFGLTDVLQKIAFNEAGFVSGFALSKLGTLLAALSLLLIPSLRSRIWIQSKETASHHRALYFGNRLLAGIGALLITYAISLENPAIIEAVASFKYALIFLITFLISKLRPNWLSETFTKWALFIKVMATAVITFGLLVLGVQSYFERLPAPQNVIWGTTFSKLMADNFGVQWQDAYRAILYDLKPKQLRIVAYWEFIEPEKDRYDFADLDWQMDEAAKAGVPIILTVGQKVPRWPECHYPTWLDHGNKTVREDELLKYLEAVVLRYREHPALLYWQIENEPFLYFGICPEKDFVFLDKEIALVRQLDSNNKILMTDGGEFGDWYRAAKIGDVFGTTMYRKVHSDQIGYFTYPLTPEFFSLKRAIVQKLIRDKDKPFVVIELGLEPWDKKQIYEIPLSQQFSRLNFQEFVENIEYAKETKFDTYLTWGTEWWYWLLTTQNDGRFWNYAKKIFNE